MVAAIAGAPAVCTPCLLLPVGLNRSARCGDRHLQGAEPEPEPEAAGIEVRWKVKASSGEHASSVADSILSCGGPSSTTADGHFDYSRCADDPTFRQCHREACMGYTANGGKGRRLEQADEENQELRAKLAAAEALLAVKDEQLAQKDAVIAAQAEQLLEAL